MSVNYLKSNQVLVFPSTRRSNTQPSARYHSESTFTNIISRLCDYNDGTFIITQPDSNNQYDSTQPFEFMIYGYYFRINKLSDLLSEFSTDDRIYAYINLDQYNIDNSLLASTTSDDTTSPSEYKYELKGFDNTNYYTGLKFSTKVLTNTTTRKGIELFNRNFDETGYGLSVDFSKCVVIENLQKYSTDYLNINIDGGEIL